MSIVAEDRKNSKEETKKKVVMKTEIKGLDQLIILLSVNASALVQPKRHHK